MVAAIVRRVNHTGISVRDLDRSLGFYVGLLGLEPVFRSDIADRPDIDATVGMEQIRATVVFLDAGDTRIEMWQYAEPAGHPLAGSHRAADHGIAHVAFEVDDVEALYQRVVAAGYEATTKPVDLGIHKTFYVYGPDGEIVELLEDLGSSREDMARISEARRLAAAESAGTEVTDG